MIVLVGFMGAGKTTVGHMLAEKLGLPFLDTDLVIEQRTRRTVREIFAEDGEPKFRALESQVTAELLGGPDAVVALGGGGVEHPETRRLLHDHRVIYLDVAYVEAMTRVALDEYRPLLRSPDLQAIYRRRLSVYAAVASHVVSTDGRRPEVICLEIIERLVHLPSLPAGTQSILVACTGGTYDVHVGAGILADLDRFLPSLPHARSAAILAADADWEGANSVADALRRRGLAGHLIQIPDREEAKDLVTVAQLAGELADLALHKDDVIVGVGGEIACDLAGFVASTYNRGMPLVLVPTTLVAQADSAVGGKASLNLPQGRNLIGTVHQPVAVVADVAVAVRQRARGYRAGLAEIVKHALISGGDLVSLLTEHAARLREGDVETLARAVASSVAVKAAVVSNDEREQGSRLHLNYGHTFGHAIEHVRGADATDDGEAVAVGMMAAAYLARRQGRLSGELVSLHRRLLADMRLPTEGTFDLARMRDAWLRDKKYQGGVRFVILNGLGVPESGVSADEETLVGVLHDLAEGSHPSLVSPGS